jgi:hypothetical protein
MVSRDPSYAERDIQRYDDPFANNLNRSGGWDIYMKSVNRGHCRFDRFGADSRVSCVLVDCSGNRLVEDGRAQWDRNSGLDWGSRDLLEDGHTKEDKEGGGGTEKSPSESRVETSRGGSGGGGRSSRSMSKVNSLEKRFVPFCGLDLDFRVLVEFVLSGLVGVGFRDVRRVLLP